jgi:hypothetical protein
MGAFCFIRSREALVRTLRFDKIVGNDFEQHRSRDAGPNGWRTGKCAIIPHSSEQRSASHPSLSAIQTIESLSVPSLFFTLDWPAERISFHSITETATTTISIL